MKKSLCIFALGFEVTVISKVGRHINKILKIQSNEQKKFQPSKRKRRNKHDLWTEYFNGRKVLARRRKGRH
jgi:ribosomal protein L34